MQQETSSADLAGRMHLRARAAAAPVRDTLRSGELRVDPEWLEQGVCVISVAGEVDLHTAASLEVALDQAVDVGASGVILDLTGCSFLDSTGLNALSAANRRLGRVGSGLSLVASQRLLRMLEMTSLDRLFTIYGSRSAALAPMIETWKDEAGRRTFIRAANEQLERTCVGLGSVSGDRFVFICECGDRACTSLLDLTLAQYESVRDHPARFVVARNHENPEAERVVLENGRFAIVETVTGGVAEAGARAQSPPAARRPLARVVRLRSADESPSPDDSRGSG